MGPHIGWSNFSTRSPGLEIGWSNFSTESLGPAVGMSEAGHSSPCETLGGATILLLNGWVAPAVLLRTQRPL
eukprot:2296813-Karenia_brevis.AAC.1